jgi:amino acid permease
MPVALQQMHAQGLWTDRVVWVTFAFLIVAPLSCLQSLDALKWTSLLSLVFIFFLVVLITLFAWPSSGLDACADQTSVGACVGNIESYVFNTETLRSLSVFVFGYTCQQVSY